MLFGEWSSLGAQYILVAVRGESVYMLTEVCIYACTILILHNDKCSVCMSPGNQEIGSFPIYSCSCNE